MNHCKLEEGRIGFCRSRKNVNNRIVSSNYGKLTSIALDPIEKKPLRNFYSGSKILSVGSFGCNLHCPFCQNHEISMNGEHEVSYHTTTPEKLVEEAKRLKNRGNIGIAYTYNEPMIGFEFVRDCAVEAGRCGLKNVVVTNGCVEIPILEEVLPYIDAFNIDLKCFNDTYYKKLGGDFSMVKEFIKLASKYSHVEITALIIPDENDTEEEMRSLAAWLASLKKEIPLHISRFFPRWKMDEKTATDISIIYKLKKAANEYLENVYMGNC